jgi:hypothetical protein
LLKGAWCDPLSGIEQQIVKVHGVQHQRLPLVGPGQHQQAFEQASEAVALLADAGQHAPIVRSIRRRRERHVGQRTDHRQRRPKLVRGVGGEALLLLERPVEPLDHVVERRDQPPEFVLGGGRIEAHREILCADALGGQSDLIDRP